MADIPVNDRDSSRAALSLKRLEVEGVDPRGETPLFAAGLDFARRTSGPLATAFLESLPEDWAKAHLVIDSTLVWLRSGFRQGQMFWGHEPFPGQTDGVPGHSNLEREAEHIACCFGPAGIEFLAGPAVEAEAIPEPCPSSQIQERHRRLQEAIEAGTITTLAIPPFVIYRYGWGAFHRFSAAGTSGFQFWIRATRGDRRPLVNGMRNATNL